MIRALSITAVSISLLASTGCRTVDRPTYPAARVQQWMAAKTYAEAAAGVQVNDPRICVELRSSKMVRGYWVIRSPTGNDARGYYAFSDSRIAVAVGPDGVPGKGFDETLRHEMGHHVLWRGLGISDHDQRYRKFFVGWDAP